MNFTVFHVEGFWSAPARTPTSSHHFLTGLSEYVGWRNGEVGTSPGKQWQLISTHARYRTREELLEHLAGWVRSRAKRQFHVLMISGDGHPGGLSISTPTYEVPTGTRDQLFEWRIQLPELADVIKGKCANCGIMFSACQTMRDQDAATAFMETTGARFLFGYQNDIDWIDGAFLDTALLYGLRFVCPTITTPLVKKAVADVKADHPGMWERAGAVFMLKSQRKGAKVCIL